MRDNIYIYMFVSNSDQRGYLLVLVLVFGAIFFVLMTTFMGYVITQKKVQDAKKNQERALSIAEAGLSYYKWYLAHNPTDIQNGTGVDGPYVIPYDDPEGGAIGEYSLDISSNTACGDIMSIDIESTGYTYDDPTQERTLYARYAKPTVSEYAYIINSNVWAGSDRTIIGPYHSNGGIRMDGTNNSTVTSGIENWSCTSSFGCSPTQTVDGVFGAGPNSALWTFPSTPINFVGITLDLSNMQTKAATVNRDFGPSGDYGYLVDFQSNNTFNLYRVTGTQSYSAYNSSDGNFTERNVITGTSYVSNYSIPSDCSLLYFEDKVWLEGEVSTRVTLAAADVDTIGVDPTIVLNDNITYTTTDSGLLAIAEDDVLVGLEVPDDMSISGIFVAQNGRFGRNHYTTSGLPSSLDPYVQRNSLTMHGTIVSSGRVGTKWSSGGVWTSGFGTRYNSYDRDLVEDPPPLTPNVSDTYSFIDWREED